MERIEFGKYLVADLEIGQGEPIFKGTWIPVQYVLEMVAEGMDWEVIVDKWRGGITKEAIAEAVSITSQIFLQYVADHQKTEGVEFGNYLVADPKVCQGQLMFKGTRIFVQDVLEMVAKGIGWKEMRDRWRGRIPKKAIAEAVSLASQIFLQHVASLLKVKEKPHLEFGTYIVSDPKICHGILTFKGTRIFVQDVLEMVAKEMNWDQIIDDWRGSITKEAIAEAISIASQVFIQTVGKAMERIEFGKYVVADPKICHGNLTFKGTRIFVQHVLEMVADGMDWNKICDEWDNVVSREAIVEAIRLAESALIEKAAKEITA